MLPIFLIVGAPAVGKSTVARALAAQYPKSIHIPVDNLRNMVVSGLAYPSDNWGQELIEQLSLARESAVQLAIRYNQAGFMVALDDFWDPNSRLLEYQPLVQNPRTRRVLLYPTQQTAQERNQKRSGSGDGSAYIAAGIQAVYERLQGEISNLERQGWTVVDTTERDVAATVKHILAQGE